MNEETEILETQDETEQPAVEETISEPVEETTAETIKRAIDEKEAAQVEFKPEAKPEAKPEKTYGQDEFAGYKKEARAVLATLPDNIKGLIRERENSYHKGQEQYKEAAHYAQTISQAIAPHADYLKEIGSSEAEMIPNLLSIERQLRTGSVEQKAELFQKLAYEYGINLNGVAQLPFDPQQYQLQNRENQLNSRMQQIQAYEQSQSEKQIYSVIDQFAQQPGHEYFEDVKIDMANLIDSGQAENLEDAYTKAVERITGIYTKHQPQQNDAIRMNKAAKAAKAAAISVKGSPAGQINAKPFTSTEDIIREQFKARGMM